MFRRGENKRGARFHMFAGLAAEILCIECGGAFELFDGSVRDKPERDARAACSDQRRRGCIFRSPLDAINRKNGIPAGNQLIPAPAGT